MAVLDKAAALSTLLPALVNEVAEGQNKFVKAAVDAEAMNQKVLAHKDKDLFQLPPNCSSTGSQLARR